MVSEPGRQVQYPWNDNRAWCEEVHKSETGILRLNWSAIEAGLLVIPEQLAKEKMNRENSVDQQHNLPNDGIATAAATLLCPPLPVIYWNSTDARNLFGAGSITKKDLEIKSRQWNSWQIQNVNRRWRSTQWLYGSPGLWNLATLCYPMCSIRFWGGTNVQWHYMEIVLLPVLLPSEYVWCQTNNRLECVGMVEHSIPFKRMLQ